MISCSEIAAESVWECLRSGRIRCSPFWCPTHSFWFGASGALRLAQELAVFEKWWRWADENNNIHKWNETSMKLQTWFGHIQTLFETKIAISCFQVVVLPILLITMLGVATWIGNCMQLRYEWTWRDVMWRAMIWYVMIWYDMIRYN